MRIGVDVHWGAEGVLEGEIAVENALPVSFHGVLQFLGLVETSLGPPPADPAPASHES